MKKQTFIASFILVLAGVFTFLNVSSLSKDVVTFAGTTNFSDITLSGNLTTGGLYATTTASSTAASLAEREIKGYSTLVITGASSTATNTIKFPASSTIKTLIPKAGDRYTFNVVNATTTGVSTLTLTTNTGITLVKATSTAIVPVNGVANVTLIRKSNTDVIASINNISF